MSKFDLFQMEKYKAIINKPELQIEATKFLHSETKNYLLHFLHNEIPNIKFSQLSGIWEKNFFDSLGQFLSEMGVNLNTQEKVILQPLTLARLNNHKAEVDPFGGRDKTNSIINKENSSAKKALNELSIPLKRMGFSESGDTTEAYFRRSFFGLPYNLWNLTPEEIISRLNNGGYSDPWKKGVDIETFPVKALIVKDILNKQGNIIRKNKPIETNPRANEKERRKNSKSHYTKKVIKNDEDGEDVSKIQIESEKPQDNKEQITKIIIQTETEVSEELIEKYCVCKNCDAWEVDVNSDDFILWKSSLDF